MELSDKTELLAAPQLENRPSRTPMFERVTIIGTGLIGGSLGRDLRRLRLAGEVVGHGRSQENLQRSMAIGSIDRYHLDPHEAVKGADLVVLGVPLGAIEPVLRGVCDGLSDGAIVTDVGSAKTCTLDAVRAVHGSLPPWFVPGHPIAGTERSGPDAAIEGLFAKHRVILTPVAETDADAVRRVGALWAAVGAQVLSMRPERHDEVLAATSHLPHLLAFSLVDMLGGMEERAEIFRYAAGGFRDFTRIASSDPVMWHDICMANKNALGDVLRAFAGQLDGVIKAVESGDSTHLHGVFERAKARRDRFTAESRQGE